MSFFNSIEKAIINTNKLKYSLVRGYPNTLEFTFNSLLIPYSKEDTKLLITSITKRELISSKLEELEKYILSKDKEITSSKYRY